MPDILITVQRSTTMAAFCGRNLCRMEPLTQFPFRQVDSQQGLLKHAARLMGSRDPRLHQDAPHHIPYSSRPEEAPTLQRGGY